MRWIIISVISMVFIVSCTRSSANPINPEEVSGEIQTIYGIWTRTDSTEILIFHQTDTLEMIAVTDHGERREYAKFNVISDSEIIVYHEIPKIYTYQIEGEWVTFCDKLFEPICFDYYK